MAKPNPSVNPQITEAVTQPNVKVLGDGPAMALANLYQASGQALSNTAHNSTAAQQNANTLLQTTTLTGVSMLYAMGTATTSVGISEILSSFNNNS